jgi:hypothetical protein
LPPPGDVLYPKDLPDQWTCAMNTWHPAKASCRCSTSLTAICGCCTH